MVVDGDREMALAAAGSDQHWWFAILNGIINEIANGSLQSIDIKQGQDARRLNDDLIPVVAIADSMAEIIESRFLALTFEGSAFC